MADHALPTETVELNPNGELFDEHGDLVKFKPTKAVIGGIVSFLSLSITGLASIYTGEIGFTIAGIIVGSAATVLGVYVPSNKPAAR